MHVEFVFYENVPSYQLVFFCTNSKYITILTTNKKEITHTYYDVENDILRTNPLNKIYGQTHTIELNNNYKFEVGYVEKEQSPLCVDFLMPTSMFSTGISSGKNKIFASATIFKKNTKYHLLDHAVAGKQDLSTIKNTWNFKSYGYFISKEHTFSSTQIPICYIQSVFLKQIQEFLKEPRVFDCDDRVRPVTITPFHLNNRMFFAIPPFTYLKYVKIPSKPVFGPCSVLTEEKQMEWVVNQGYQWIYNNKPFSREFHGEVLVSAWKSLFLQDCGNCLDMAITMYQILMSYFSKSKHYKFGLASVLVDNYLPHCVCVMIPLQKDISQQDKFGRRPFIVDATRAIDIKFSFDEQYKGYCDITYKYITGLYTQENCYWVVNAEKPKDKIYLDVNMSQFLINEYTTTERYKEKYPANILNLAHKYER